LSLQGCIRGDELDEAVREILLGLIAAHDLDLVDVSVTGECVNQILFGDEDRQISHKQSTGGSVVVAVGSVHYLPLINYTEAYFKLFFLHSSDNPLLKYRIIVKN